MHYIIEKNIYENILQFLFFTKRLLFIFLRMKSKLFPYHTSESMLNYLGQNYLLISIHLVELIFLRRSIAY